MLIVVLALVFSWAGSGTALADPNDPTIVREYLFDSQSGPATPAWTATTPDTSGNGFDALMGGPEGIVADPGGTVPHNGRVKKAESVLQCVPWGGIESTYSIDRNADTVAMWFKTDGEWINGVDNWNHLFYGNGNAELQVGGNDEAGPMAGGFVQSWSWNGGVASSKLVTDPVEYDDGEWHHVVRTSSTYTGGADGGTHLYIDGVLVAHKVSELGTGSNNIIKFGANSGTGWSDYFSGHIDNCRIYSDPLSADQVLALYESETDDVSNVPLNPSPANGAPEVAVDTALSWEKPLNDIGGTCTYDVYLQADDPDLSGVTPVATGTTTMHQPGADLLPGTTYYWRVDPDCSGTGYTGTPWNFTTVGPKATNPNPTDDALGVDVEFATIVTWTPDPGADSQDVYFGQGAEVNQVLVDPGTSGATNSYNAGLLIHSTDYFWRVDSKVGANTFTGDQWNFQTVVGVCDPLPAGDTDNDCDTDLIDFANVSAGWMQCNWTPAYLCN